MVIYRRYGAAGRGRFHLLVDRKKDVIICGGENIYPVQIEDFLHTNSDIKDVAVIGMPDRGWARYRPLS
jgi:acyl-CoA synthetase (AMP-forming)/AMP-acid ligase II